MGERRQELIERFNEALSAMPAEVQTRHDLGQQFNVYDDAENEEDGDPDWWEFHLAIGPITNMRSITTIEGEATARLIEAALKLSALVSSKDHPNAQ